MFSNQVFFLIYLFYIQSKKTFPELKLIPSEQASIVRFIIVKKLIATFLVPIFLVLAIYSLTTWIVSIFSPGTVGVDSFNNINNIFFEDFFTVLIFADVLILLFSFFITDDFHKVIRNSGFIISTILIRLSFAATGLLNTALIISAVVFGLVILIIHNQFEKKLSLQENLNNHEYDA